MNRSFNITAESIHNLLASSRKAGLIPVLFETQNHKEKADTVKNLLKHYGLTSEFFPIAPHDYIYGADHLFKFIQNKKHGGSPYYCRPCEFLSAAEKDTNDQIEQMLAASIKETDIKLEKQYQALTPFKKWLYKLTEKLTPELCSS